MQYRHFLFLISIILICGCNSFEGDKELSKRTILGSWRLYDIENSGANKSQQNVEKLLTEADDHDLVKQGMIISFFKDGTYTEMEGSGHYRTCKWEYSSKNKTISFSDSGITRKIAATMEIVNEKQTVILSPTEIQKKLEFIREAEPLKAFDEDPFYFKNNSWRIKPTQLETHDQLVKRLGNYFKHLLYILKSAKERKNEIVSFEFSMGIVRIYNGGIGIVPFNAVPENWVNTYYNEANAQEAYYAFQKYLATSSYKGASTGNWIEDDYNILLGIYADTQKGKF